MPQFQIGAAVRRRLPMGLIVLAIAASWLATPSPSAAQERSETGRRKPPVAPRPAPEPRPAAAVDSTPVFTAAGPRWLAGIGGGLADGGELFRAETDDGTTTAWGSAGQTQFRASRFTAKVDAGPSLSAHVARRLGAGRWWLRAEVAHGVSDIAAEALQGQGGEVFFFDRLSRLSGTVGAEARLTAWPSHPYASFGLTACRLAVDRETSLNQTGLGGQAALGYRQRFGRGFVAIEAQVRRIALDLNDFAPSTSEIPQPTVVCTPADDLWLMELRIVGSRTW